MKIKIGVVVVLLFLTAHLVFAQKPNDTAASEKQEKENELAREKAFQVRILDTLHSLAKEAYGWGDVRVSSRTQAQAADLIWDLDAISAENYLVKAWDKAKQSKESDGKPNEFRNTSNRVDVSGAVIAVARKRSPELAKKWLKELSDLADEDFKKRNDGVFDDRTARSAVLLQLALQALETDPQAAAALAIESLRDGVSFGLQTVLVKIQEKNPELAMQVFRVALQRINSAGIKDASEIQILYSYIYAPGQVFSTRNATSSGASNLGVLADRPAITPLGQLNPALAQEFLLAAGNAILRLPFLTDGENPERSAREQYGIINSILYRLGNASPQLSQSLNERLVNVTANANFAPQTSSPSGREPIKPGEGIKEYRERLLDEVLDAAEKIANPLQRDIFIAQRVLRSEPEQFEKAKGIAEHIGDKELREQIVNFLTYRASLYLIKKNRLDEAYKLLQKDSEPRHRASILIVGGQKYLAGKNIIEARDWLNDASKLFKKNRTDHQDWINIGFGLVAAYAEFDKIDAVRQLESTVKLIDKNANDYNRDNAPLAFNFSGLNFSDFTNGTKNFSLNSAIRAFSKEEFETVLSSLDEISNRQAKGEAILSLCKKHTKLPEKMEKAAAH